MKNKKQIILAAVVGFSLMGCASVPPVEDLTQLNGQELKSRLVGNTWTSNHKWGLWTEYHLDESTGIAKASGDWGTEEASSSYSISDEGEGCWSYDGEPEWADPSVVACAVVLVDDEGNLFSRSTRNDSKPERVGKIRKIQIKPGDAYGLSAQ